MPHDPAEHVIEVFPGIDVAVFAGLDQTHVERRRMPATLTADKEPILSSQGDRPHGVFRGIVVRFEKAIVQIPVKRRFLIQAVVNGLSQRFRWNPSDL